MRKTPQLRSTFRSCDVEKVHAVVARSTFWSQNVQNTPGSDTFGSCDVEKVHAVVARSTFPSQNVQNTSVSDDFWKLRCRKSARRCGAKHISKSKCTKHHMFAPLLDVEASFCVAGARDCAPCQKWAKREGFITFPKPMAGVGHLKRICKDACFRGGRTRDMFIRDVRRSGRWFPEKGCVLEHQIFRFAEMILRDRCSTSYDLASFFRGRRSTLDRWSGKNAKRIGTRPSALHSTFYFWRKSGRIVSFLMLSTSKTEDVLQNCFVFDAVKFKNWGSLAELFRFWRCQVQKMRKSRKKAAFSSLQIDRLIDWLGRWTDNYNYHYQYHYRYSHNYSYNNNNYNNNYYYHHYYYYHHQIYNYNYNYTTLQCTTLITLQHATATNIHATTTTTTTPHFSTLHNSTLHSTTLHYTNYMTLHLQRQLQLQLQLPLHGTTLHYANYNTRQLQLHYSTRHHTRLHYTIPHYSTQLYSTLQYTTISYTNCTTPQLQLQLQLHYTNYITLELQLTTTTPLRNATLQLQVQLQLHHTTLHPTVVVRWPLQPLQPLQKTQLQPPFGPSVDSPWHPWFTTTNLSYRFPIFETSATALCGTTGARWEGGRGGGLNSGEAKARSNRTKEQVQTKNRNTNNTFEADTPADWGKVWVWLFPHVGVRRCSMGNPFAVSSITWPVSLSSPCAAFMIFIQALPSSHPCLSSCPSVPLLCVACLLEGCALLVVQALCAH